MTGQVIKKVIQKLKRPEEEWYFNAPPEILKRFQLLLELASAHDYSQFESFSTLVYYGMYGTEEDEVTSRVQVDRGETVLWKKFQDEVELHFGRIDNDSCSTLATMDDNPGTGRIIDNFFYRPIGRSIERLFLNLELRYFHPPEKSARRIKRFLEGSTVTCFRNYIPVFDDSTTRRYGIFMDTPMDLEKSCVSLFREIGRDEKIAKAFQILLAQAR